MNPRLRAGLFSAAIIALDVGKEFIPFGEYQKLVNCYAHDLLLPPIGIFFAKAINSIEDGGFLNYTLPLLICSAGEIAQKCGAKGTYDPKDFIAYALGAGLAFGVDILTSRKDRLEERVY